MTAGDLTPVFNEDERWVRDFCAARDRGDADAMQQCWGRLVENNLDRVKTLATTLGGFRLTPQEREDAASAAFVRLWDRMGKTFKGSSPPEFYAAIRTCVNFALMTEQRKGAKALKRTVSVDEHEDQDHWVAGAAKQLHDGDESRRAAQGFVQWALPRMKPRHRIVMERDMGGVPDIEIATELETTTGNVQQMRSRGLTELRDLWNDYEDQDA